ncbi:NfeD family protein, partial [Aquisalimonas sp.]|uniref:NfeD family protein n=1 Tax=Aquisalimonas sp. TaxID=1872621 RepID=UPI0025C0F89A
ILSILMSRGWLGAEGVVWIMALWLAKDVVLYPLYRPALMTNQQVDAVASLEGSTGYARTEIADRGLVLVRGEFWRARATSNPIPVGTRIRVHGSEGRVLIVEALRESTQTAAE